MKNILSVLMVFVLLCPMFGCSNNKTVAFGDLLQIDAVNLKAESEQIENAVLTKLTKASLPVSTSASMVLHVSIDKNLGDDDYRYCVMSEELITLSGGSIPAITHGVSALCNYLLQTDSLKSTLGIGSNTLRIKILRPTAM